MVRSMYSGVVGMRAQQSAMDTIGNNIANVKTYGFKASRTTFKDVYYQTMKSGAGGTSVRGGTNPSQIGYGAQLGSVDVLHGQSSFSMTGRSMDMAIAGEGFFQVMDSDGNKYFTRAGQLTFDPAGNLVDSNGNFVLGVNGDPLGKGGASEKIQLSIPAVSPAGSKVTETINSVKLGISAANNTEAGDVSFNFMLDSELPGGQDMKAEITGGGTGITIRVNPTAQFANIAAMQTAINNAITAANGGVAHPAGDFSFTIDPANKFPAGGLSGEEIVSKDYSVKLGSITGWPAAGVFGGMKVDSVSSDFKIANPTNPNALIMTAKRGTAPNTDWTMELTIDGQVYKGTVTSTMKESGKFLLTNATGGSITMTHPGHDSLESQDADNVAGGGTAGTLPNPTLTNITVKDSAPSRNLGLESTAIKLEGGTKGGPQGPENLESILISADGVITAKHGVHGEIAIGRIDIATFANPSGLIQAGNTYFQVGPNCGKVNYTQPGRNGSGELAGGSLEQSSVDLSQEFSDMITTQRAYQANSRLITVSDTMLEELVNLKR